MMNVVGTISRGGQRRGNPTWMFFVVTIQCRTLATLESAGRLACVEDTFLLGDFLFLVYVHIGMSYI